MQGRARKKRGLPSPTELLSSAFSPGQLYVLLAALAVLANARLFYGSLKLQTEHVHLWFQDQAFERFIQGTSQPSWSAPLDDVFIHFDFARSVARGAPFEWTAGNGYSSGGTSLLYPFVLAVGFLFGHAGLELMQFAGVIACVGTFAWLNSARTAFARLPPHWALLAPPALLSVGALNWTYFSGMEVALFLALYGTCFVLWSELLDDIETGRATRGQSLLLGAAAALLVASRPEAAPLVAIFGFWVSGALLRRGKRRPALSSLLLIGTPGALIVLGQMSANYLLTGTTSAAGALAKLEMHHPYLTSTQVVDSWKHFTQYQFLRLTHYHFSTIIGPGYVPWLLGLMALVWKETRRPAGLLWLCIGVWIGLVALNGQVRWQNERYTMPAVSWLLLTAALGTAGTLHAAFRHLRSAPYKVLVTGAVTASVGLFLFFQAERFREQVWFFGRASRNILEQHVRAGAYLGHGRAPRPQRILLSDAGALPYASDLPAFDLIGLGGYEGLPVAGASRQGAGAALELMEHLPKSELPDIMALYPSWWSTLVLWFGQRETEFPVRGNVICGGAAKVIYVPDWRPLEGGGQPFSVDASTLLDEIDVADVLSEHAHRATWNPPEQGYVVMKMLPNPSQPKRDLWDAGRLLSTGMDFSFELKRPARELLVRAAPATPAVLQLEVVDTPADEIRVVPSDGWQELTLTIPEGATRLTLRVVSGELEVFHLFAVDSQTQSPEKP